MHVCGFERELYAIFENYPSKWVMKREPLRVTALCSLSLKRKMKMPHGKAK